MNYELKDIAAAARAFVDDMAGHRLFAFYGPMGAGKTTFIRAVCEALGTTDVVTSPTFAIINEYNTRSGRPIYHFDFYRIRRLAEVYDIGYEDYFYGSDGICLMEWPELVEPLLPPETVRVTIAVLPDGTRSIDYKKE
ncbi:MAG: tRNA (adenosine(37)-N6)-threonylcarbamoyltransferase complex ATPase subunit type 1 TsaE [Bacteroidaceae bacterium]|nr:tRNA (adenosine(37)-N6)-threonylcarbamoyltransferase complex ATPase subunit type 1 TsaE [Bacteroidaceae bacterium]